MAVVLSEGSVDEDVEGLDCWVEILPVEPTPLVCMMVMGALLVGMIVTGA